MESIQLSWTVAQSVGSSVQESIIVPRKQMPTPSHSVLESGSWRRQAAGVASGLGLGLGLGLGKRLGLEPGLRARVTG